MCENVFIFFIVFVPLVFLNHTLVTSASELWVVHPAVLPLLSIAAIFSGPLNHEGRDFTTAPLVSQAAPVSLGGPDDESPYGALRVLQKIVSSRKRCRSRRPLYVRMKRDVFLVCERSGTDSLKTLFQYDVLTCHTTASRRPTRQFCCGRPPFRHPARMDGCTWFFGRVQTWTTTIHV